MPAKRHLDAAARARVAGVLARLAVEDRIHFSSGDDPSQLPARVSARIAAIRWGTIELIAGQPVRPGATLNLDFGRGITGWGEVDRCTPKHGEYDIAIALLDGDFSGSGDAVRREPRYAVNLSGVLQVVGVKGACYAITILDASQSGLRVQSPRGVESGLRVEIASSGTQIWGEVRYSREVAAGEFHLGVQVGPNARVLDWLDLGRLAASPSNPE